MLYLLVFSILAGLIQVHAVENEALTSDTACRSGEAGAVFVNVMLLGNPSRPEQNLNRTYSRNDATSCLKMDDIKSIVGSEKFEAAINNISPISGGYCQLYSTDNCDEGKVMELANPLNYYLKYPE
jgi:hypothetical protein